MKNVLVALSLALSLVPVAAIADDQAPAPPTAAQRQQMMQAFGAYHQREEQLHQQFRAQILGAISPVHRSALANLIGQLAISSNPNLKAAASQIDALLSAGERAQIVTAHNNFRTQSKALHEQMRAQMQNMMPADHPMGEHPMGDHMQNHSQMQPDAGEILLHVLGNVGSHEMGPHMWGGAPPPPHR